MNKLFIFSLVFLCATFVKAETLKEAVASLKAEMGSDDINRISKTVYDYLTNDDLPTIQAQAKSGVPASQMVLGEMYIYGKHVTKDVSEGVSWYTKSAETNYLFAQFNLCELLIKNELIVQNFNKAFPYCKASADLLHPNMSYVYLVKYYLKAVSNLGDMYLTGKGTPADPRKAYTAYTRALGDETDVNGDMAYKLGEMTEHGVGIKQSNSLAKMWYKKAAAKGNINAKEKLLNIN